MKITTLVSLALALSLFLLSGSKAEEEAWYEPGSQSGREITFENMREGYQLFRNNCKKCHFRGNEQNAVFLCPESKTMNGWNRVFARENSVAEANNCLGGLSAEELMDLNDYLYSHASNAVNPHDELECNL